MSKRVAGPRSDRGNPRIRTIITHQKDRQSVKHERRIQDRRRSQGDEYSGEREGFDEDYKWGKKRRTGLMRRGPDQRKPITNETGEQRT